MKKLYIIATLLILALFTPIVAFGQTVTVTSPNGGESWQPGSFHFITFTDNIGEYVRIHLYKGGVFDSVINDSTRSDGSTNWDIPVGLTPGTDYKVKITSVVDTTLFDFSDADFTIETYSPFVSITSPNGGESWPAGSFHQITFTDNLAENIKIDLYKGGVYDSEINASTPSDGSTNWTIPAGTTPASDYKIRITSVDDTTVFDFSDANFTIDTVSPPFISITSPNGGESWEAGSFHVITFDENIVGNIKIELFKNGVFNSQINPSTPSDGSTNWTIPAGATPGSDYKVKITSLTDTTLFDFSDADFTISPFTPPFITVTSPNGGEDLVHGSGYQITFTDNIVDNIKIDLYKGGFFDSEITGSTPSDGSTNWTIPAGTAPGSDYKIKITSLTDTTLFDFSDADFAIGSFKLTEPNGGENWPAGSFQQIKFVTNHSDTDHIVDFDLWKGGVFDRSLFDTTDADGSKNWNIPTDLTPGSDYRIKIVHHNDSTDFDFSDADFTISPFVSTITVTAPNGGEVWPAGNSYSITWTDNLTENVKIDLYKSGTFDSVIDASTVSDGSSNWDIPPGITPGSDYKIKITSVDNSTIFDFSDTDFTIGAYSPVINVTSPNGGEVWAAGSQHTINWTDNIIEKVKIELWKGGILNSTIIDSTNSDGSKIWDIPAGLTPDTDYKVKIISVLNTTILDTSDADFTISAFVPQITLNSPNGGESWAAGTSQPITWTDNLPENIKIDLFKGGVFNSEINASTMSDGTLNWNIPSGTAVGSDYKIKITSVNDTTLFDFSDADFTITAYSPLLSITSPNGGESWGAGTQQTITWTDNIFDNVRIELWKGGVFNSLIIGSTPSDGSKIWNIPGGLTPDTDYKVKTISVADTTVFDFSDADFTVTGFIPQLTLDSPNGGEEWKANSFHFITFTDNIDEFVRIHLYKGGVFHSIINDSTRSDGSTNWTIPRSIMLGTDYKVKITSVVDTTIFDFSDANFSINEADSILITSPNGGEDWMVGTRQYITWIDNIPEIPENQIKFELWKGGVLDTVLFEAEDPDNSKIWDIAESLTPGNDYKVKLIYNNNTLVTSISDSNFTLSPYTPIVTSPNGGESWQAGSAQTITFIGHFDNDKDVKIDLYKGGVFDSVIKNKTRADGTTGWNIPTGTMPGSDYKIRIESKDDTTAFDFSDADFTIYPAITVTTPNGGESWGAGTLQTITWIDSLAENVKIELFKSGTFDSEITASTESDGNFLWNIPGALPPAADYSIKITSVSNTNLTDISDAEFSIFTPVITVTSPNGAENYRTGTAQTITWTDNISEHVKIELYKGGVFNSTIADSTESDGSHPWTVPVVADGSDYTVVITSTVTGSINDVSNAGFSIFNPAISVTSPNGGENYRTGSTQTITWADNIAENVKIELFKSGVFNQTIVASASSDGSHDWTVPVVADGSDYTVVITSTTEGTVTDVSDADFSIFNPVITLTSPNGGENYRTGTAQTITWTDNISENVKIDLFKSGVFNQTIVASTSSDGSHDWTVPVVADGSDYTVVVTSTTEGTVTDVSDADFSIFNPVITLTSPNGGENYRTGTAQTITWTDNISEDVKIELFKGGVFNSTIVASTPSDGSHDWTVPVVTDGADYTVVVTSTTEGTVTDVSDAGFSIFNPVITVTSPNGGENYRTGTAQTITWTDNISEDVKIELFKGGVFNSTIVASTPSDGTHDWTVPVVTDGADYTVVITSTTEGTVTDVSDADFSIFNPVITLTSPNGGENYRTGTAQTITWTDNISEDVKIELFKGGVFNSTIVASTPSDGSHDWTVPVVADGADYTVVVTSTTEGTVTDVSDADFSIFNPVITVTSPNGGENYRTGTAQTITWTDNIAEDVKIELFKGGVFNSTIVASTPSDGSHDWTVPVVTDGADYTVVITSTTEGTVTDVSDADFSIFNPVITLTSPNGGENYRTGTAQTITWTDNISEDVKIELFKGGVFNSTIVASTPSDGTHDWTVPVVTDGADYTVVITSTTEGTVTDVSDAGFSIFNPVITVTSPNGGENYRTGTAQTITWTDNISEDVKIELFKGGVFNSTIVASTPSDGTHDWTVPVVTDGADYTVVVTSTTEGTVTDVSDADFSIFNPVITVTSPNGGENYRTGTAQTITWTDNISEDVKIELFKGGVFNSTIVASTPSDGTHDWTVPVVTDGADYTVVITSTTEGTVTDVSDADFSIFNPVITLTSPNGGENYRTGTAQTITWTDNISEDVKIELFKGGVFNSTIVASTPSDGSHDWTVPVVTDGADYTVVVTSTTEGTVTDVSDADFSIFNPVITLTSPNGGENYRTGTAQTITWTDNISEDVKIELFKGGVFNSTIVASTPSDGSHDWTVPVVTDGADYTVVITSTTEGTVTDVSDADFSIFNPVITVTSPNGGENYRTGTAQTITWTDNIAEDVKIELFKGGVFNSTIVASTPSDGSHDWTVPVVTDGADYTVVITSTTEGTVTDVSDAGFSIFNPVITVTSPNGGENYRTGTAQTITWTDNIAEDVKIELFKGGVFNSTIVASTPSDGSHDWTVPVVTDGADYTVVITSTTEGTVTDVSDADFSIFNPVITLTSPNGGENYRTGTAQTITWTDNIAEDVKIELFKGGVFNSTIVASTPSDSSHDWTVPVVTDGADYTVVITSTTEGTVTDVSDADFSIFNPVITVTSPNGGENYRTGTAQTITWTDNIAEDVKIELFKGGVFNSTIVASTPSDGSHDWTVPAVADGADYTVVITSTTEGTVTDVSDADFSIFNPVITLTSPNGGENYRTGTAQTITWTDNIAEDVKIELFKGGVFNSTIVASTPSDGSHDWTVPVVTDGADYTVVITSTTEGTVTDVSDADFSIFNPVITLTSPNGGENYRTGTAQTITWTDNISEDVKIELFKGGVFNSTIVASTPSDSSHDWTVPVVTDGADYTVVITSTTEGTVTDVSDADFSIFNPVITLTSPNGGENYRTGTAQTITWTDNISEDVKIELFKGGVFNSTIVASTPSDSSHDWTVPVVTDGADYTVVITSTTEGTVTDVSDADFSIFNPVITLTSPNGGENYRTGTAQTITWTDNISEDVKIELFKGGVFNSTIVASTPSDGSHDWTVPVVTDGADYTVVITSTTEGTVTDVSDADFSIFNPVITLTSPNGGENYRTGTAQTITWTDNIAENVKIELFKGGVFNSTIVASTPSDGSHDWTVPVVADGADYTVVITSTTEGTVTDVSDADFSIFNPVITLTSPNGEENYRTGTAQTITWTDNISEDVKIELFKGGVFNSTIVASTPSDGSHDWTVPVVTDGADYTVVITSTTEGTVTDVSDADFSIFNPVITVTSPNGGENYRTGTAQTITWTDNISEDVKIELFKGGVFNSTIVASTPSDSSHDWTVPVVTDGADYTVVITSTTEGTVTDVSDADFSIFNPVITLTSPNGGENYRTGTAQTITWTDNISEDVKIELFKGGVFNSTIVASTPSDGSHDWTVPVVTDGADYTVVITSTTEGTVTDVSDADFSIFNPVITLTSPNGGENYRTGTAQTITWTDNISEDVKIELFKGGVFNSTIVASTPSDGSHDWTVPAVADGADYTVVVTSTTEGTVTDVSDADFSIFNPVITLTSPNGGENYRTGTAQTITWTDNISEDVKIELFKGGVFNSTIVASTPSDGSYDWTVPAVADGADYTVVITSTTEGTVTDVSDADFSIFNPVITLTSPNGGENYRTGTAQTITWTDNISEDVKIELFKGGVFNSTIVASTPSDGSHDWTVPAVADGADYTVVIISTTEGTVTDVSDADFSIFNPVITLTSPNGGENYRTGTAQTITWTDNISEELKIELFKGGVFNSTIVASTPSDGSHDWTVPVVADGADYTVVVTSTTEGTVTDVSDADFSIFNPVITLTSPNGEENYRTGTAQTITWTDNISEDVRIELFKGGVFNQTIVASTPSDGSHDWTVPVIADGADYTVVITSTTEGTVTDVSDADFSIFNPVITLTSPIGGENYRTGTAQTITWTDNISEDVKIELFKGGVFNSTIVASTPSDGSHDWTVPAVADGADYTVVVTSTTEGTVTDVSDADFSIFNPVITVTSPNGGENYRTGTAQTITWTDNISEDVKIELFKGGVFNSTIVASTPSDGSHDWTVPVVTDGADYTVVITSTTEGTVTDISDADFSIFNPVITLTSPNGGENYRTGTAQTITWTDNISEDVKIELFKGGVFNSTIVASTPSDGSHDWTVPVVADGADYTVVVTSTTEGTVTDVSDADFSIFNPVITVTSPNGGENYRTGTAQTITWTDNISEDVKIELFKGGVFNSTIVASTPSDGSYDWTVPAVADGADYTVVITSTTEGTVTDVSDADFSIFNPVITLTSPNGGENYRTGTAQTITWTDNISEDVKIELFKGGVFNSTIVASTPSDGSHDWTVPAVADGADYTVVIISTTEGTVTDVSDADFSIFNPVITLTSPNGGENYRTGTAQTITWTDNISEELKIELFKGGVFNSTIVASTPSDGSHDWTVPEVADGADYTVVITSTAEGTVTDVSDADFSIFNPVITLTSPNGGENYRTGTAQTITWTDNISEELKIELFKGGVFNSTIVASTPSDGSHDWTVPVVADGADYTVVITSTAEGTVTDVSDADFSIFNPVITLTSPNGGEIYEAATGQTITWTDNIDEEVKIELFKGGVLNQSIVTSTPSDGSHDWTVPVVADGADYTVVITSTTEGTVTDVSDAVFSIINPVITLTSPNGGEIWDIGTSHDITWTDNTASNVKIDLFKGGVFNSTIVASTPSDGSYNWTVPSVTQASDYTVVITSTAEGTVTDVSDANFTIQTSTISVTSPNGGENYRTGTAQTITWTDNIAEDVKIELFKGGVFNSTIVASTPSNGAYNWTVPTVLDGSDYTVVITSTTSGSITDVSDAEFSIFNPVITLTSPNGGENYRTGSSQTITWTDNIVENVKIELFKGGVFESTIVASTPSDGSHDWTVPVVADGSDYTVVITSTTEGTVTDVSDAGFSIFNPVITVTSPNGGEIYEIATGQTITWTDNIAENVKIELYKGGLFSSTIVASTPSDGSHSWTIPVVADGADYKVVITSTTEGAVTDASDAEFSIFNPVITITSPNGSEIWDIGTSHDITWTDNTDENVKIDLFKGGVFNSTIVASTASDGIYNWTVPVVTQASDYSVVLTSVTSGSVTDVSDANFTIQISGITVSSPNGDEVWEIGDAYDITWTDNIAEEVKIELFKGGVFNSTIVASTPSDGSYNWTVPSVTQASDYTVVITSVSNGIVTDVSDANFTIQTSTISVTSPDGGEILDIGTSKNITWIDNIAENVKIELFKGGIFHSTIVASTPSDGTFNWTVPVVTQASDYTVVITSVNNSSFTDVSDANFTIQISGITVSSPNGNEVWEIGSAYDITWTDNIVENIKIDLFKGGVFNSTIVVSTPSDGTYNWTIPAVTHASDYTVVITSVNNGSITDVSDANFTIQTSAITVLSPNGGESWSAGTTQNITWTDNIAENVTIDLYKAGVFHSVISTSADSDGSRNWDIPFDFEGANDYKVKITSVDNPSVLFDFSDADFTIVANQVTVTAPNGGEQWLDTEDQIITWTDNLTGNVEIQLFKSDVFHSSIITSTPSDGEYTWNISATTPSGSDYKVKIISVEDGNVFDFSDSAFTIVNNDLTVLTPNGGENWLTNTSQEITWTDDFNGDVKIDLYKADVFDMEITSAAPSDGSFIWNIPGTVATGSDYKIKITSVEQPVLFDMSNASFTIFTGLITVNSPNGGEIWQAGSSQLITWADNITEDVTIDLYKGGVFHSVISTATSSDGLIDWNIPFDFEGGNDYKVKITSVNNPGTIYDFSDTNFTVVANQITVTSPNGGEDYLIGSSQIITWTDNLFTGNVEIQLFKGGIFNSSITTSTASDGSHTWNIPNSLVQGSDYKIRISSVTDGNIFDFSDAEFTLSNEIIVTIPNGGESWRQGTTHTINWTDNLNDNVKIELLKGGTFDSEITASTPSDGSFSWDIPVSTAPGLDYTVQITSVDNATVFDVSNADFEIFAPAIDVSSPNGGESWSAGTTQNITWTDNITEDVSIDLYKGGVLHTNISTSTNSDGLEEWIIPFTQEDGNDYSIKITSVDNPGIYDISDTDFAIVGKQITVTSPNGGDILFETDDHIITWTDNLTGSVEIQLFKNDVFHSSITTSTPSDGEFTWNPPSSTPTETDYKVKISSVDDAAIFDFSDSTFTIISNNITVTSPNGDENWLIGSANTITWTDDISGEVKIELYKGGVLDTNIAVSAPSNGNFEWDFADATPGMDYQIKISSVNQPALFDMSDNNFTLFSGEITVTSPNGGENWMAGSSQTIFWDDNIDGDVEMELYRADTLHSIISGPTASDGAKTWDIPFDFEGGSDFKVKITSVENPDVFDYSDANFSIEGFEITVTSPNGGEVWYVGQDYNITWTENLTGSVEIHLFKNGDFHSVIADSDPSDGTKTWSIPSDQETGTDYTIKITSNESSNIFDFSDSTFSLAHNIVVSSPNGSESWLAGSAQTITWSDNLVGNVKLELYRNYSFDSEIINSAPSNGSYTWDIPITTQPDTTYKVKITSAEDTSVYDYSDSYFEIYAGSITVVSPNGGETFQAGTAYTINWTSNINETVKIELYKGGSLHTTIVESTDNDGSYNWTDMPFTTESGTNYQVKISSIANPSTFDFSDGNFTIVGKEITVIAPNGGEEWIKGEPYFITWEDNLVGEVEIQLLSGDNFDSFIKTSEPSDGTYTWVIPENAEPGTEYKIRIVSRDNSNILDESDDYFTISNPTKVEELFSGIPDTYELMQNFPNPFNPSTTIYYALPEAGNVELVIYDILGNEVQRFVEDKPAGYHKYEFNAINYKSGVYFYRIIADDFVETKKMIFMK